MNARLSRIISHPKFVPVTIGTVSFGIGIGTGIGIGYLIGIKKIIYNIIEKEIEVPEEDYEIIVHPTLFDEELLVDETINNGANFVAEKLTEVITVMETEEVVDEEEPEIVNRSIFANNGDDNWDQEEEQKGRSSYAPYVLHKDEFHNDELGYKQSTLVYYSGDNIMVDEEDTPIYNHFMHTGPLNFGHGSGDPKVFYIRNDKLKVEYEIIKDEGLYSVEVLGLEIEDNARVQDIKHSVNRKFRDSD